MRNSQGGKIYLNFVQTVETDHVTSHRLNGKSMLWGYIGTHAPTLWNWTSKWIYCWREQMNYRSSLRVEPETKMQRIPALACPSAQLQSATNGVCRSNMQHHVMSHPIICIGFCVLQINRNDQAIKTPLYHTGLLALFAVRRCFVLCLCTYA